MDTYYQHLEIVKDKISVFDDRKVKFLSLCNCQRQFFAYKKAAKGHNWNGEIFFTKLLNDAWADLIDGTQWLIDPYSILQFVPEDIENESVACAVYFCDSIVSLIHIFKKDDIFKNCESTCEMGLHIVDVLAYNVLNIEVTSSNDEIIAKSEIFSNEINLQKKTIKILEESELSKRNNNFFKKYV
ncbi:hypothetical protein [Flavobacterium sp. UBA4854]|uniref:hypothetical protein n=1 Tax=Flavobacterium sp. UBA4854 TaxID=1946548 RepID=UPI00257D4645|nr:hypothetical protein [Flavobacterium sp. UBA4854]